jgi:hypothetical protein
VLARLALLLTAVAFVLLSRPTEQLCAQQYDDEHASRGSGDDVSLRPERRHSPAIRLACTDIDGDGSDALAESWEIDVLAASMQVLALGSSGRSTLEAQQSSSISARGPPSFRS